MKIESDIVVIGSGMAGLGSISWLKSHFAGKVVCVSESGGGSALTSGAIAPIAISPGENDVPQRLLRHHNPKNTEILAAKEQETVWQKELCNITAGLLEYREYPYYLLDGWGRLYETNLAQHTQTPGDLSRFYIQQTTPTIGIVQFGDTVISPYPAQEYNRNFPWLKNAFVDIPINVPLSNSVYTLAAEISRSSRIQQYIQSQIQEQAYGLDILLFPCIFGVEEATNLLQTLQKGCSVPLAEMLGTHPSPPGIRWQQATLRWLVSSVTAYIHGKVIDFTKDIDWVRSLQVHRYQDNEIIMVQARSFVLASGNIAGGGLYQTNTETCQEAIFNCPVTSSKAHAQSQEPKAYSSRWLTLQGIQVNENSVPVANDGEVLFRNVVAAGDIVQKQSKSILDPNPFEHAFTHGRYAGLNATKLLDQSKTRP